MWSVTNDQVGTGVDHKPGEEYNVASRLPVILLFSEWQMHRILAFGTAVKRNDNDIVCRCMFRNSLGRQCVIKHHVGIFCYCVCEYRDVDSCNGKARKITLAPTVRHAGGSDCFH